MPGDRPRGAGASPLARTKHEAELELAAQHFVRLLRALLRNVYALDPDDPITTDLPVAQLRLTTLLGEEPRTVSEVAKEMGISVSGVTQLAHRLESAGLVERMVEDGDRRVRRLALTSRGIELVRRRSERRVQSARELLAKLPPAERRAALDTLRILADEAT
jgi:DNA-binding MarR family transcriptional regulator